jgi:hypothetical protein
MVGFLLDDGALVSGRTPDEKTREGFMGSWATVTRRALVTSLFHISPTCQTAIRNKPCSTARLDCGNITLLRACSNALHEDER